MPPRFTALMSGKAVAGALATHGIVVRTADRYATNGNPPHALRIALGIPSPATPANPLTIVQTTLDTVE
jgi:hypothetical protein